MIRKGQVTIFVIVAIIIAGGIIIYFSLDSSAVVSIPQEFRAVYDSYLSCLEEFSREGVLLMGSQGGYIEVPEFEPGSQYMPFSSQLNFLGQSIPYWIYVSGNNLLKEQVPTKVEMQRQLGKYVEERLETCDFSEFESSGYDIYVEKGDVDSQINELSVDFDVYNPVTIHRGQSSIVVNSHKVSVDSKLGKFYDLAMKVYDFEKENMFLENYALDVMRLYAPVTGTEVSCTPKVFVEEDIHSDIVSGLSANIPSLKLSGNYYELSSASRDYFVVNTDFDLDEKVNFMYNPNWPTRVEIYGDRVVEPVGLQEGMSILGFCYVAYHLVYDINFPVLLQFYDDEEIFQFPVSVVISKNKARKALPSINGVSIESKICEFKNQPVEINTYDINLRAVESRIRFKCLNSVCEIGETKIDGGNAVLQASLPQCVNGFIVASAEGYADAKYRISTNEEGIANVVLSRKFDVELDLDDVERALVSFNSDDYSATVIYPESDSIELVEGYYNVSVYAYSDSSLKFPAVKKRRCVDVPEEGLGGFLGLEKEKCFDVDLPEMEVDFAVVGGGKTREYITEEQIENSNKLNIEVPFFGLPKDLEELQRNHAAVEDEVIYIDFS